MGCSYYPVGTCATNLNSFVLCWCTIKSQHQYANSIATNADCALDKEGPGFIVCSQSTHAVIGRRCGFL